jgi:methyl-accepting chemotaxis protein
VKIRSKMFLLGSSALLFLAMNAAVYSINQAFVLRIEAERRVLMRLSDSTKDLSAAIALMDSGQLDSSKARFEAKKAAADASFEAFGRIKELPRVNATLKESVEIIDGLASLASDDLTSLAKAYDELREDAQRIFFSTRETTLRQFYTDDYARKKYDLTEVYARLDAFDTLSAGLIDTLAMNCDVIAERSVVVDKEVAAATLRGALTSAALGVVLVALALILSFVSSRSIAKPLIAIESTIGALGSGDLRVRSLVGSKDELGRLGGELNGFLDALSASIREIQVVSSENLELKGSLADAAASASSSAVEIDANASSIGRRVEGLDASIAGARGKLENMTSGLMDYARRVSEQDGMISSSADSMDGVIGSMDEIGGLADGDRAAADALVAATAEGRVVFSETFERLSAISKSVTGVSEMADVIREIAERTNLLAMNAAIEAAHAGESGRGFAVVADEIRKLSSAASDSSKTIGDNIASVVRLMNKAEEARDRASRAFEAMDNQIRSVTASSAKLDALLKEIRGMTAGVRESIRELRASSASTADATTGITESAASVGGAVAEAARVSQEVRANISEIAAGLSLISSSVFEVSALAGRIGETSARLDAAVNAFQADATPAGLEPA